MGLEKTGGFETIAFCENDINCRKVLEKHWPGIPIFKDIKGLSTITGHGSLFTAEAGDYWPTGINSTEHNTKIDLICGGFPCQDISVAGKGEGIEGKRSGLWTEYHRVIGEVKPKYVIIENVANLRSKGLNKVLKDLWSIGYDCEWHIISASAIGALHKRERIWIIAYSNCTELWEQSGRRGGPDGENKIQPRINGENGIICDTSSERFDGCLGEKRHIQTNQKRDGSKAYTKGPQRESFLGTNGKILSERCIEGARSSSAGQWELVSRVHRVVNGLSKGLERARKQRIKQLGNAVVPQIPQLIGQAILDYEKNRIPNTVC